MALDQHLFDIAHEGLRLAFVLSLPILAAAFLVGLLSAVLQGFTKVSETALTHIPRIAGVTLVAIIAAPSISRQIASFTERVWALIQIVHP